ncbi:MAG: hypothetical protein PVSMB7_29480 [Chloroflexota bacterium]
MTVYGRGYGVAPVLGRLGLDHSLDDVASQIHPYEHDIRANSGQPTIRRAIHLIYAMAVPCISGSACLMYLDDLGVDIIHRYIKPAAKRGWLVVLDDQLGRSSPVQEMRRLIDRGYLRYDNVQVAFDPEFHTNPSGVSLGSPVGSVSAPEMNAAAVVLDRASAHAGVAHQKLLMVHEWSTDMLQGRDLLQARLPYVQMVVIMDGIGPPPDKAVVYRRLFHDQAIPGIVAGIKLFLPSRYAPGGTVDIPSLTWNEVFGRMPVVISGGRRFYLHPAPRVVVLT